jgi:hypothetical protein
MSGYSTDDDYARYLTEDEKECPLYKQALLAYEEKLECYNNALADRTRGSSAQTEVVILS